MRAGRRSRGRCPPAERTSASTRGSATRRGPSGDAVLRRRPRRRTAPHRSCTARRSGRRTASISSTGSGTRTTRTARPFRPASLWQVHEGDWEAVSVILDLEGSPLVLGLSRHSAGARRAWSKVRDARHRPLVYVGLGSHANFFEPGAHRLDPRVCRAGADLGDRGRTGAPARRPRGSGRVRSSTLVPVVTASRPSWMAFAGTWGEERLRALPDNEPIPNGSAPRGPAFHEQLATTRRRGVVLASGWPRRTRAPATQARNRARYSASSRSRPRPASTR